MIALKIDVQIDDRELLEAGRQVPFVMSKAMNSAMIVAQSAELAHIQRAFTIRRKDFAKRSVKITRFAKKGSLVAELAIAPPGNREDIFAKFEAGGVKRPRGRSLAIPITGSPVKRTERTVVSARNRPRVLLDRAGTRGLAEGAFLRPAKDGKAGAIFIRRGKHILLAYTLDTEAPLEPTLEFEKTVSTAFTAALPAEFDRWWAEALRTRRP